MQLVMCLCDQVPTVATRTRIALLMHKQELVKTSNTGQLARLALPNSEQRIRGERDAPLDVTDWFNDGHLTVVLFPSDTAVPLASLPRDKPIRLVVPDATWSQARRMVRRTDGLEDAPKVILPAGLVSEYGLRKRKREGGVCTLEAITEALVQLEGEHVRAPLEHLLTVFVDRMLFARGRLRKDEVFGGVPPAALRQRGGTSSGYLAKWFANRQ